MTAAQKAAKGQKECQRKPDLRQKERLRQDQIDRALVQRRMEWLGRAHREQSLNDCDKVVAAAVMSHINANYPTWFLAASEIMRETGKSETAVRRSLARLIASQYLVVGNQGGGTAQRGRIGRAPEYSLALPPGIDLDGKTKGSRTRQPSGASRARDGATGPENGGVGCQGRRDGVPYSADEPSSCSYSSPHQVPISEYAGRSEHKPTHDSNDEKEKQDSCTSESLPMPDSPPPAGYDPWPHPSDLVPRVPPAEPKPDHLARIRIYKVARPWLGYNKLPYDTRAPSGEYRDEWLFRQLGDVLVADLVNRCRAGTLRDIDVAVACVKAGIPPVSDQDIAQAEQKLHRVLDEKKLARQAGETATPHKAEHEPASTPHREIRPSGPNHRLKGNTRRGPME